MDTPAVAKFAARIRMFDRVIASASLALSNLPDDSNDRHAMLRATIDSMAEDTAADLMRSLMHPASEAPPSGHLSLARSGVGPIAHQAATLSLPVVILFRPSGGGRQVRQTQTIAAA
jgi:hypothetical protein